MKAAIPLPGLGRGDGCHNGTEGVSVSVPDTGPIRPFSGPGQFRWLEPVAGDLINAVNTISEGTVDTLHPLPESSGQPSPHPVSLRRYHKQGQGSSASQNVLHRWFHHGAKVPLAINEKFLLVGAHLKNPAGAAYVFPVYRFLFMPLLLKD